MDQRYLVAIMFAALALACISCGGKEGLGGYDPLELQTLPMEDAQPEDVPHVDLQDGWSELPLDLAQDGELTAIDILPDLPPLPCDTDDDCPATGIEPCVVNTCVTDEVGARFCRTGSGLECASQGPCTKSVCVAEQGCVEVADNPGAPCDDANACTTQDQCSNGLCVGVEPDCDDANPCTADLCDPVTGACYHLGVATECDDGNACTAPDQCFGGACQGGPAVLCDDFNECTVDSCAPATGCQHAAIEGCCLYDLQCNDGNACTKDLCVGASCQHEPVICVDDNPCTTETCSPDKGCLFNQIPGCCQVDQDCNDADLCTYEWCAGGKCQYQAYTGCKDNNPCTLDTCDPQLGCVFQPIPECCLVAGDCDDGNACTYQWCEGNVCQSQPIGCSDGNSCTTDGCDPDVGCVFTPIPNCCLSSADCDDSNACTEDWCTNKKCQHKEVICLDTDICTSNLCDPDEGCAFPPIPGCCHDDSECADSDPCTITKCSSNKCAVTKVTCNDDNPCTADSCVTGKGCQYVPLANCCLDAVPCNDGDPCTADLCVNNTCQHTPLTTPECCQPDCGGKECGPNGCGGSCGSCVDPFYCNDNGQCVDICIPDCTNKECGPDGCGTFCGICPDGFSCSDVGQCVPCFPQCGGKECGPDGCGGSCGICPDGLDCESAAGQCVPPCEVCEGPECFQDGFEAGELDGWSFEGDAEVIHNMGVTEAPQGWYMAFVGTGLSELELGKLQKTFCPPSTKGFFGFKWRLYSAEFTEWCGSIYQDRFIVTINNGVQQMKLLDLTIDDLCPESACAGCGTKYIGLAAADVEFDYPDVWVTPWSTAFFELPEGYTDTPVTVTLEVSDVGDMVYVTAVLLDAIQFL